MNEKMKKIKYISIIMIIAFMLTGCGNKAEKIAEQYCDILIKENYEDMLDIAYLPDSKFLTDKRKDEAKEIFAKKMKENKKTITTCTTTKSKEDDNKIYYKLTINDNDSLNIEVDKKTNKVYIDDLYEERSIESYSSSKVSVDGVELSNPSINDNMATYKFTAFKNVSYDILATNPSLKDKKGDYKENYIDMTYQNDSVIDVSRFKDDFIKELDDNIKPMFKEIALVGFNNGNKNTIKKYFIEENFEMLSNAFKNNWKDTYKSYTFKNLMDDPVKYRINSYINDTELKINVTIDYERETKCIVGLLCTDGIEKTYSVLTATIKKDNNTWKIANWE